MAQGPEPDRCDQSPVPAEVPDASATGFRVGFMVLGLRVKG